MTPEIQHAIADFIDWLPLIIMFIVWTIWMRGR